MTKAAKRWYRLVAEYDRVPQDLRALARARYSLFIAEAEEGWVPKDSPVSADAVIAMWRDRRAEVEVGRVRSVGGLPGHHRRSARVLARPARGSEGGGMSAYTPGPWTAAKTKWASGGRIQLANWQINAEPMLVVALALNRTERGSSHYDGAETEANARLIAAAPDLLAALKAALTDSGQRERATDTEAINALMRAAIAKAEGWTDRGTAQLWTDQGTGQAYPGDKTGGVAADRVNGDKTGVDAADRVK